jgi:hypothetical protein
MRVLEKLIVRSHSQEILRVLWNPKVYCRVRFQVLTTANLIMTTFWDIASCSLRVDRRFRGAYFMALMKEAYLPLKRRPTSTRCVLHLPDEGGITHL